MADDDLTPDQAARAGRIRAASLALVAECDPPLSVSERVARLAWAGDAVLAARRIHLDVPVPICAVLLDWAGMDTNEERNGR